MNYNHLNENMNRIKVKSNLNDNEALESEGIDIYNDIIDAYSVDIPYSIEDIVNEAKIVRDRIEKKIDFTKDERNLKILKDEVKAFDNYKIDKFSPEEQETRKKRQFAARHIVAKSIANARINTEIKKLYPSIDVGAHRALNNFFYNIPQGPEEAKALFDIYTKGSQYEKQTYFDSLVRRMMQVADEIVFYKNDDEILSYFKNGRNMEYANLLNELQGNNLEQFAQQLGVVVTEEIKNEWDAYRNVAVAAGANFQRVGEIGSPYYPFIDKNDASFLLNYVFADPTGAEETDLAVEMTTPFAKGTTRLGMLKPNILSDYTTTITSIAPNIKEFYSTHSKEKIPSDVDRYQKDSLGYVAKRFYDKSLDEIQITDSHGKKYKVDEACAKIFKGERFALRDKDGKFLCRLISDGKGFCSFKPPFVNKVIDLNDPKNIKESVDKMLKDIKAVDGFFTRFNSTQQFKDLKTEVEKLSTIDPKKTVDVFKQLKEVSKKAKDYLDVKYSTNNKKSKNEMTYKREDLAEQIMNLVDNTVREFDSPILGTILDRAESPNINISVDECEPKDGSVYPPEDKKVEDDFELDYGQNYDNTIN